MNKSISAPSFSSLLFPKWTINHLFFASHPNHSLSQPIHPIAIIFRLKNLKTFESSLATLAILSLLPMGKNEKSTKCCVHSVETTSSNTTNTTQTAFSFWKRKQNQMLITFPCYCWKIAFEIYEQKKRILMFIADGDKETIKTMSYLHQNLQKLLFVASIFTIPSDSLNFEEIMRSREGQKVMLTNMASRKWKSLHVIK